MKKKKKQEKEQVLRAKQDSLWKERDHYIKEIGFLTVNLAMTKKKIKYIDKELRKTENEIGKLFNHGEKVCCSPY